MQNTHHIQIMRLANAQGNSEPEMHLSYNATTSLNFAVETASGDNWEIDWGDGIWEQYVSSGSTYRTKTFGSATAGVARVRSATGRELSDLNTVASNVGTWSFDVADLSAIYWAHFEGDLMTITGNVGDIQAIAYAHFQGDSMELTYTTTTWTIIPANHFLLDLATGHLTTAELSQMLIDMDASGITGTSTLDFRYNNGAPNSAGEIAADNLRAKGYTVLTNTAGTIAESPVAFWKLHTNSLDSSGNGNNGTDTGMSYVGGMANFNGGYIDVADSDDLSFTDGTNDLSFGIAFSFIWDDKSGGQFLIGKRNAASSSQPFEWWVNYDGTNLYLRFLNETNVDRIEISIPSSSITAGVENTLYFYYDGSKSHTGISAYLNGNNPIGSTLLVGTYTGQVNSNIPIRIGAVTYQNATNFKGKMKNIYLWKDKPPITGSDIDELDYRLKNDIPL